MPVCQVAGDLWPFTQMADLEPHGPFVLWDDLSTEFLCPVTKVRWHLARLSLCPSVRYTLRYRVCVINFSYSFRWILLKPCILVVDIMNLCMWVFDGPRINFERITDF